MTLNMKMGASDFSKLKTLIHEIIFVKNNIYPESIKNDNGAGTTRKKFAMQTEPTPT